MDAPRYAVGSDAATDALVDGFDIIARDLLKRRGLRSAGAPQILVPPAAPDLKLTLDTEFARLGWTQIAASDDLQLQSRLLAQGETVLIVGIMTPDGRGSPIVYLARGLVSR